MRLQLLFDFQRTDTCLQILENNHAYASGFCLTIDQLFCSPENLSSNLPLDRLVVFHICLDPCCAMCLAICGDSGPTSLP